LRIAFQHSTRKPPYGLAILPKDAYSATTPQARPAIRRRFSVLVKGQGRASIKTWAWEIHRTAEQLAVQLEKAVQLERDGFNAAKAAKRAAKRLCTAFWMLCPDRNLNV
jgi:hypothetical protein